MNLMDSSSEVASASDRIRPSGAVRQPSGPRTNRQCPALVRSST